MTKRALTSDGTDGTMIHDKIPTPKYVIRNNNLTTNMAWRNRWDIKWAVRRWGSLGPLIGQCSMTKNSHWLRPSSLSWLGRWQENKSDEEWRGRHWIKLPDQCGWRDFRGLTIDVTLKQLNDEQKLLPAFWVQTEQVCYKSVYSCPIQTDLSSLDSKS